MEKSNGNYTGHLLNFFAVNPDGGKDIFRSFTINDIMDLEKRLEYWISKYEIKAAYYQYKENGKVITNDKINMVEFYEFHSASFTK
jgi:hypothetical protein